MKAKELLEYLTKADPESEVQFSMDEGCCGDTYSLEAYDIYNNDPYAGNIKIPDSIFTVIYFKSIPGYRSCLQVGGTKRADKEWCDKYRKGDTS